MTKKKKLKEDLDKEFDKEWEKRFGVPGVIVFKNIDEYNEYAKETSDFMEEFYAKHSK